MLACPKCQRPLEDESDGVYICCAGAPLQWRCTQCAKVSEGFAFPYGQCPHCAGKLALVDQARATEAVALEGIRLAFEIELGGRAFYQRAAADSQDPELRALFGRFAVMEGEHMETLSRRYHVDVPDPSPAFRVEQAAVFGAVPHRPEDPANLFRIAIAFENRAAAFFSSRAEQHPPGSAEHELYRELAAEEREHADLLSTEYERWRAGKPGLFDIGPPAVTAPTTELINAAALLLQGHAAERAAICCGARTMSYGELRDRVARAATVWRKHGVGPGDRVAIKLCDGLEWVVAFLSTIWTGAVAVGVNPHVAAAEWQYMLDEAGFSCILADEDDQTPPPWSARVLQAPLWRREVAGVEPMAAVPMDPEAPAFWVHSSGTSGKPKAVIHAQRAVGQIDRVSREGLGLCPDDRLFASSKLFFSYSQTNSLMAGLRMGAAVIVEPEWPTAASVVATVETTRPSVLFTVPSMYRAILHEGLAPRIAAAGVRLCVSAGEALPASVRQRWREQTGLSVTDGYGASETLVLVMLDPDGQGFAPSPGIDMQALNEVADGTPTRLLVRSSTLSIGYLDRPQAQTEAFRDGAFCPADLWARDEASGRWRFAGREDSLVKIRGRWVNLVDLEQELTRAVPGVADAVAVCVPDDDGVDAVALFFVAQDEAAARAALAAGAEAMSAHRRPRWLHAIDTLPRTATGKVLRRKLMELHQAQDK